MALLRAGLWETDVRLLQYGKIDFNEVYNLSKAQSVVGLVTAGLKRVKDVKIPQDLLLQFVGTTLQIEQRNKELNQFVPELFSKLQAVGVEALLVKGQGVAQCYEAPLWRASGDVDLLLDPNNYERAKKVLFAYAYDIDDENKSTLHQSMKIRGVDLELHGRMPLGLSKKADRTIEVAIANSLNKGCVRVWRTRETDVFMPDPDNHLFLVFTHFLHHFFIEGVGLRQICDWCRMLFFYRGELDYRLLEKRLLDAGLMGIWQVFAAFAVRCLGMPVGIMPFYDERYESKSDRVRKRLIKTGDFGRNNDLNYRTKYKGLIYNVVALFRRLTDFVSLIPLFPMKTPGFFIEYVLSKVKYSIQR